MVLTDLWRNEREGYGRYIKTPLVTERVKVKDRQKKEQKHWTQRRWGGENFEKERRKRCGFVISLLIYIYIYNVYVWCLQKEWWWYGITTDPCLI